MERALCELVGQSSHRKPALRRDDGDGRGEEEGSGGDEGNEETSGDGSEKGSMNTKDAESAANRQFPLELVREALNVISR